MEQQKWIISRQRGGGSKAGGTLRSFLAPKLGGASAGRGDKEENEQVEYVKWRAQGRIARGCELVKRFAGNGEIEDWTASRAGLARGETQGEAKNEGTKTRTPDANWGPASCVSDFEVRGTWQHFRQNTTRIAN